MSAVCIITTPNRCVLATDGGGYRADGTLVQIGGKAIVIPDASTVITSRGSQALTLKLSTLSLGSRVRQHFDTLVPIAAEILKAECAPFVESGRRPPDQTAFLAGWSEVGQRYEAWCVRSDASDLAGACEPYRLPDVFVAPGMAVSASAEIFGLPDPQADEAFWVDDAEHCAVLAICAARWVYGRLTDGSEADEPQYYCGGHVQVTSVERQSILSYIAHDWPDVLGAKINPGDGEPAPKHYFATSN
jgi:hypothetical protein